MNSIRIKDKRDQKENAILVAAEKVFSEVGFNNTKMEDIADVAGISKGTVYFYFSTKENLFMGIAYKGMQLLNDQLYKTVIQNKDKTGLVSILEIIKTFMKYSENYLLYTEAILYYMSINRESNSGKNLSKLTSAIKDSIYYQKSQDIHNIPVNLVVKEIKRGVADRSILSREKPVLLYLYAWSNIVGFMKINVAAGQKYNTLHGISIVEWKDYHIKMARVLLTTP